LSGFNKWEHDVALSLEKFPRLRTAIKESYKRLVYLLHREPGFLFKIHPKATLITPQKWAGLPAAQGEWFFGYYDKSPWSSDMKRAVFHRCDGEKITVMVVDQKDRKQYSIGDSDTWNWQQGSMAQWLQVDSSNTVVFNVAEEKVFGCRVVRLTDDVDRFIPWPIQALHPSGYEALTLNYIRLSLLLPYYGYSAKARNFSPTQDLDQDGIWRVDLDKGSGILLFSLTELAVRKPISEMEGAEHKVNHLIYSPSGTSFVFLHRFIGVSGRFSRLYVANSDGSSLRLLMDDRIVSHYHWQDDNHVLVWGHSRKRGYHYYLVNILTGETEIIGKTLLDRYGDGHCSFSPDRRWIVTDTYPDRARHQRLLLYDTHSKKCVTVGRFFSPWSFANSYRCDLHPRWSPDGRWISIDSAHEGIRRTYFVDVSKIVGRD